MKAKLVRNVKKIAAVATGALFLGATLGMAKFPRITKFFAAKPQVQERLTKEIIRIIEKKGYSSAMVAGGALATSFLKENLVNEIYLNVEPIAFMFTSHFTRT